MTEKQTMAFNTLKSQQWWCLQINYRVQLKYQLRIHAAIITVSWCAQNSNRHAVLHKNEFKTEVPVLKPSQCKMVQSKG